MTTNLIEETRKQLDQLDRELAALLDKRAALAEKIGHAKKESGADCVFVPAREVEILSGLRDLALKNLDQKSVESIFVEIISACRSRQSVHSVCVLGEKLGWINAAAFNRFGMSADFSAAENFEDFIASLTQGNSTCGFAAFSPQHAIDHLSLLETLFSGKLSICEEYNFIPEFCVVSNSARDLSEVHELCVTGETLQLLRSYIISLSYDLKIRICRSTSEAYESLQSITPVAAILPAKIAGLNKELITIKSGLKADSIGLVKFLTLSARPSSDFAPGLKTTLLCAMSSVSGNFFDATSVLQKHKIKLCDVHSVRYTGKPWDTILILEIMVPKKEGDFADLLNDLEKKCLLVKTCGFYPTFR